MKLQVKNLGPIKYGEIDLTKRFYVFVGYNNSGKTYAAQLLWKFFNDSKNLFTRNFQVDELPQISIGTTISINQEILRLVIGKYEDHLIQTFESSLYSRQNSFENFRLNLTLPDFSFFEKNKFELWIGFQDQGVIFTKKSDSTEVSIVEMPIQDWENFYKGKIKFPDEADIVLHTSLFSKSLSTGHLAHFLLKFIMSTDIYRDEIFLPANRSIYPSFYPYVYQNAKDRLEEITKSSSDPRKVKELSRLFYTQAMGELFERIFNIDSSGLSEQKNNAYLDLVNDLMDILEGDIYLKKNEGIAPVEFLYKLESGQNLEMHISSSSVNQLTTLFLYLKYWAEEEGNFLIVDEPESNLHPENQLKLLNILMKFANRNNNRVLITTHSTLMADAVNNHLHLGRIRELGMNVERIISENDELKSVDPETAINPDDIGVYFFSGEQIHEYATNDYGVYFRDFKQAEHKVRDINNILKGYIYDNLEEQRLENVRKNGES